MYGILGLGLGNASQELMTSQDGPGYGKGSKLWFSELTDASNGFKLRDLG